MAEHPQQIERIRALIEGDGPLDVAGSRALCRAITNAAGSSFAVGIRLTPARCRDGMHAVYAWMRLADDAADADAAPDERGDLLARFESLTLQTLDGQVPPRSIWPALSAAVAERAIERGWLEGLLAGVRQDVGPIAFEAEGQLDEYCDRVAGNVGRCCVAIWGVRAGVDREQALALAGLRGRAFQCINIARDIADDARAGRRYVPRQRLDRLGVELHDPAVREDLLRQAMAMLDQSAALSGMVRPDAAPALWAMTRAYTLIAHRLRRRGARVSLGGGAKLGIAAGAIGRRVLAAGRLA
ncbi:MAG: squalene/phytoene synthase family protein [Phycisphaeraceae bacterium]|nr:squalene/phytoene synthase family protein [Phycisphaeraceae bacterium]